MVCCTVCAIAFANLPFFLIVFVLAYLVVPVSCALMPPPQATKIARAMVTQYGMSDKVGKVYMQDHQKEGPEMRATVDNEVNFSVRVIKPVFVHVAHVVHSFVPPWSTGLFLGDGLASELPCGGGAEGVF